MVTADNQQEGINTLVAQSDSDLTGAFQALHEALTSAGRILLSTHENPDGDGLGSLLAMCEYLKSLGKDCRALITSPMPEPYRFLDPHSWVERFDATRDEAWLAGCDLALDFDLADFRRLGAVGAALKRHSITLATIDHHPPAAYNHREQEPDYSYVVVDSKAPAAGLLVWRFLKIYSQSPLTATMAQALYTALVTDTGSFKYDNTNVEAHQMAIDLLETGLRPYEVHKQIFERRSHTQIRLLGKLLENIEYSDDQSIGWCVLTTEHLAQVGARLEDIEGFSEFIRAIDGVEVAALITELTPQRTKVSLRSKGRVSINDVAKRLGGGGHAFASGIVMEKPWRQALELLLPLLEAKLAAHGESG